MVFITTAAAVGARRREVPIPTHGIMSIETVVVRHRQKTLRLRKKKVNGVNF